MIPAALELHKKMASSDIDQLNNFLVYVLNFKNYQELLKLNTGNGLKTTMIILPSRKGYIDYYIKLLKESREEYKAKKKAGSNSNSNNKGNKEK